MCDTDAVSPSGLGLASDSMPICHSNADAYSVEGQGGTCREALPKLNRRGQRERRVVVTVLMIGRLRIVTLLIRQLAFQTGRQDEADTRTMLLNIDINEAWGSRRLATSWKAARAIVGTKRGQIYSR